jgi:hypothetical protein
MPINYKKLKIGVGVFLLLFINAATVYAQTANCDFTDPDGNCPLDTWVFVLTVVAAIFTYLYLHRRQKSQQRIIHKTDS